MTRENEANLFGRPLTRRGLRRQVGRVEQVAGITPLVFDDGSAHRVRALRFRTGGDLAFDAMPDHGMDPGAAEYAGTPLAWLSHTGVIAPSVYEPEG